MLETHDKLVSVFVVTQQPDVCREGRHIVNPDQFPANCAELGMMQAYRTRAEAVAAMLARCPAEYQTEKAAAVYGNYRVERRTNRLEFLVS